MSDRKMVWLDCETTHKDPEKARIVELTILDDDGATLFHGRISPGLPIPPEASEIHGIFDNDVSECPPFSQFAQSLASLLADVDLAGFGVAGYDFAVLDAEFRRCRVEWAFGGRVIDVLRLFHKLNPRNLTAAVKTYLRREHDGAHSSMADTVAAREIFQVMKAVEPELAGKTLSEIERISQGDTPLADVAGKLGFNEAGKMIYLMGKASGKTVLSDTGFGRWMLQQSFIPTNTKRVLSAELDRIQRSKM